MQVNNAPRQSNMYDCGLFGVMYSEYFCSMASGEFTLLPGKTPAKDRVVCEGPHAKFLVDKAAWFEEKEVTFLRILYQAALCDLWNGRPPVQCPQVQNLSKQAMAQLRDTMGTHTPKPGTIWCALLTAFAVRTPAVMYSDETALSWDKQL